MAKDYGDMVKEWIAKFEAQRAQPNLTPAQKAKLTKKLKKLNQQLEWYQAENALDN